MALDWKYSDDKKSIILPNGKPKKLLKVTGTRFASILGLNDWSTPFQMWCEITKAAKPPFEGNMYTEAGTAIEPKVINYLKEELWPNTLDPEEFFGSMLYRNIRFDFYKEQTIFGGMWDCTMVKSDMKTMRALGEIKTTKRSQDWMDGPPIYYLLQVCLYAYLSGVNRIFLTASFLKDEDYGHPELFVPTEQNTKIFDFNLSELTFPIQDGEELRNYTFEELVEKVLNWYKTYIDTGRSPEFDEVKDKEYLAILRKASPKNDKTIDQVVEEINELESLVETIKKDKELVGYEKRIKTLKDSLKLQLKGQLGPDDKSVKYMNFNYAQAKETVVPDVTKMKKDGIFDDYSKIKPGSWRLTKAKEDE